MRATLIISFTGLFLFILSVSHVVNFSLAYLCGLVPLDECQSQLELAWLAMLVSWGVYLLGSVMGSLMDSK